MCHIFDKGQNYENYAVEKNGCFEFTHGKKNLMVITSDGETSIVVFTFNENPQLLKNKPN